MVALDPEHPELDKQIFMKEAVHRETSSAQREHLRQIAKVMWVLCPERN